MHGPAFSPSHETAKIGADNPDNLYQYARLDGRCEYRVTGRRGTVAYLSFGTQKGGYETDGKMLQTGFLDAKQLEIATDGSFEIVLSETPRAGNWCAWSRAPTRCWYARPSSTGARKRRHN